MSESNLSDPFMGRCLVASPYIEDPRFRKSVIFICGHDEAGAMGLVVNHPHTDITLLELLEQSNSKIAKCDINPNIYIGGPVETDKVFIIHTTDYESKDDSTYKINDVAAITANLEILNDIASCKGPKKFIISIGYASWIPGQLENEVISNNWFLVDIDDKFLFDVPPTKKWEIAWARLGIDPSSISRNSGIG